MVVCCFFTDDFFKGSFYFLQRLFRVSFIVFFPSCFYHFASHHLICLWSAWFSNSYSYAPVQKSSFLIFIGLLLIPLIEGIYCWVHNIKCASQSLYYFFSFLCGCFATQYSKFRPFVMLFALAVSVGFFSFTLILRQNPAHIAVTSPLIENIRRFLPLGTTYAVAP